MAPPQRRPDRRYAHPPGPTFAAYSPDGKHIITVGTNNAIRKYTVASEGEPVTLDENQDSNTGLAVLNDRFVTCSEDGTVSLFSMDKNELDQILVRCTLPTRDIALSPDGSWVAVASDETTVKLVNTADNLKTISLREQTKSVKHVSFHPSGSYLAASCTDGTIFVYSLSSEEPQLLKKLDGVIPALEPEAEATSKVAWHPDGRVFATVTAMRDIVVISRSNWERQKSFVSGHTGPITDIAWSPNGAFIASAGSDGKLLIWESEHQKVVARYDQSNIVRLAWHPSENIISFTNSNGELVTLPEAIPEDLASQLKTPLRAGTSLNGELEVRTKDASSRRRARSMSRDSLNDLLDIDEDEDDFIIDDDGAGYVEPGRGDGGQAKRRYDDLGADLPPSKRRAWDSWTPTIHEPFQPGSTPWRGNRRYLSLNLIGFVWTVDQETHNTVTVEFYDREAYRDFHFTDPFLYNKACLNENGTLFSSPSSKTHPATILYRPHETWSTRSDFRIQLPEGEEVISIALSDSYILACTSTSYVRVYSLFGIPVRIFRAKHHPIVTCASWRDYIMILGNGPIGPDGRAQLTYTIENVKRDATLQLNDVVALPSDGGELQSVFFTDSGDPVIYDSSGVLLILQHWRQPGQSRWVPILDTRSLERLAGGGKEESYWPVAVAQDKFHCIILKGGEKYPYFPRPLLSEFDFKVPIGSSSTLSTANDPSNPAPAHEETVVRQTLFLSLLEDFVGDRVATANEGHQRSQRENAVDKALLQLLALECKEDHGEKALELCSMFAQPRRTLELAIKVALKYNRGVLAGKIGEMRDEVVDLEMEM